MRFTVWGHSPDRLTEFNYFIKNPQLIKFKSCLKHDENFKNQYISSFQVAFSFLSSLSLLKFPNSNLKVHYSPGSLLPVACDSVLGVIIH